MHKKLLYSLICAGLLLSACSTPYNCGRLLAGEKVITTSPNPDSIYLYTPAIAEGFGGRFVVAVESPISETTRPATRSGCSCPTTRERPGARPLPASR